MAGNVKLVDNRVGAFDMARTHLLIAREASCIGLCKAKKCGFGWGLLGTPGETSWIGLGWGQLGVPGKTSLGGFGCGHLECAAQVLLWPVRS